VYILLGIVHAVGNLKDSFAGCFSQVLRLANLPRVVFRGGEALALTRCELAYAECERRELAQAVNARESMDP
jgi:hypothetical protein